MTVYTGRSVRVTVHEPAYVGRAVRVKLAAVRTATFTDGELISVRPAMFVGGAFTWLGTDV